jgi:hypothetical protein
VRLVTAAVVRLERTLAHEGALRCREVGRDIDLEPGSDGRWCSRLVGWHRPPTAFSRRPSERRPRRVLRGHAAPVDTGSTAQRYAVVVNRVKPSTTGARPVSCQGRPEPTKRSPRGGSAPTIPVDNRLIHRGWSC